MPRVAQNKFKLSVACGLHLSAERSQSGTPWRFAGGAEASSEGHLPLTMVNAAGINPGARSAKVGCVFASDRALNTRWRMILVSVRRVLESYESSVIQEWWPDSRRGHRCGRARTAPVTTAASCDIRAI